ncbi:DUF6518 family protein [Cellulomonas sp. URHE0023]|uniref:DUF6518 family protein n=1 Tax=Cellulomonas sp. URHE0023 TaxID=1380354 RepID=UPI00068F0BDE|nr:DUF6518 family protein [Cellulomonas sp. URHE0023]
MVVETQLQVTRVRPTLPAPALLAAATGAGLVVGAATSFGQTLLGDTAFQALVNAVSPWLVVPFLLGALARTWWLATSAGLLVCVGEVAGYYVVADLRGFAVGSGLLVWVVAGVVGGPLFGAAGRSWRTATGRWRGAGVAALVGCWVAEAIVTYGLVLHRLDEAIVMVAGAAVLTVALTSRGRQGRAVLRWLPAAVLLGAVGFAGVHALLS